MAFIDVLNKHGVSAIQYLQERLADEDELMNTISHLGHPEYAFTVLLPIVASFNTMLAAEVFVASFVSEWCNTLLKWLLMENRPYWWVHETNIYHRNIPKLRQGPLTCETGPGCPSGHVMGTAAVLYILANFLAKRTRNKFSKYVFWFGYAVFVCVVAISRMYLATHFPHQCVLGAICGFGIGYFITQECSWFSKWRSSSKILMLSLAGTMCLMSLGAYWIQKGLGIDPQWSIKLAFKWCEMPTNIHVNSTPLYSLVRDCGAAIGLGLISPICKRISPAGISPMVGIALNLFICGLLHIAEQMIPTHSTFMFYSLHMVMSAVQPIFLLGLVSKLATVRQKRH